MPENEPMKTSPYLSDAQLAAISEIADALPIHYIPHTFIAGQCPGCQMVMAKDAIGKLLRYVQALKGELSESQKDRTDWEVACGQWKQRAEKAESACAGAANEMARLSALAHHAQVAQQRCPHDRRIATSAGELCRDCGKTV